MDIEWNDEPEETTPSSEHASNRLHLARRASRLRSTPPRPTRKVSPRAPRRRRTPEGSRSTIEGFT